jgi:hypothetical protein
MPEPLFSQVSAEEFPRLAFDVIISQTSRKPRMSQSVDPRNIEVIDDALAAVLRQKTPAERVAMIGSANRTARMIAAAAIQHQHPDWNEALIQAEVIRRVCGGTN